MVLEQIASVTPSGCCTQRRAVVGYREHRAGIHARRSPGFDLVCSMPGSLRPGVQDNGQAAAKAEHPEGMVGDE